MFIEMSKGGVLDVDICKVTNKYKTIWKGMDDMYRCIRTLSIDANLIDKNTNLY